MAGKSESRTRKKKTSGGDNDGKADGRCRGVKNREGKLIKKQTKKGVKG